VEEPQAKSEQEANTAINTAPSSSLEVAERAEQVGAIDFRTIVEQLSDTILLIDRQAQIVYANPAAEKIFNGTTATLKGKNFFDFVHPDDRPLMRDRLEEIIEHPEREYTDSLELRLKLPQSPRRVISVRGCSELDNPTVQAIVLTVRDITERRQQSEKRKIQTRMLEQMMNGLALSEVMNEMCLSIENYMTDWLCSVMLVE
jgi:PAS domain S-box-containing protein